MMKKIAWAAFMILSIGIMQAQTDEKGYEDGKWKLSGVTGVNLAQTTLSNWAAGGENSFSGNAYLNGSLLRKSGNWLWQNTLVMEYGVSKNKSQGMRKTIDNFNFSTQLGYTANNIMFYTLMGDLKTQFYKGYNYPDKTYYISNLFAPAYSNISVGLDYRPKSNYSIYFSPVSTKMTFVEDDYLSGIGAFGIKPGNHFRFELGSYLKGRLEQALMENISLVSAVDFFTPYDDQFGNIDISWDILVSMKINKYLSTTLNMTLKYDNDVKTIDGDGNTRGAKVQFKEVLGVGIAYNF